MVAQFNMLASLALLVTSAIASPVRRQSNDNGSCNEMMTICAQASDALTNPWKTPACLFGAACFGGQRPVDGFLAALCATKNGNSCSSSGAPTALDSPRVSSNVFDSISTDGQAISQQNWIDGYYHTLDATNGPYPTSPDVVIDDYSRLTSWTAYCEGNIPLQNFADYYQYSPTVNSNGCSSS